MPASPLYTEEFFETVSDWKENTPDTIELVYMGWGWGHEQPDKNESLEDILKSFEENLARRLDKTADKEKMRCLAVFAVNEVSVTKDYVVIVDDGDGTGIRSWTVASELVSEYPQKPLYRIPGATERDDALIPYVGTNVMGGLGRAVLFMSSYDQAVGSIAQFYRENEVGQTE